MQDQPSVTPAPRADWQVTAQVHATRDGWESSRQVPTFTIPRVLAPTLNDAVAKVPQIINPYGDYDVSFDIYTTTEGRESYRAYKQSRSQS